jgi:hypothetical protein
MLIDHIGLFFFPEMVIFRIIGRLAFPLFAFGIAFGYTKTKNVTKYGERLLLLALISQPIFSLLLNNGKLNICFTLLLGLLAILIYDKIKNSWLKILSLGLLSLFTFWLQVDYGVYGVLMILFFYIFRNNIWLLIAQSILTFVSVLVNPGSFLQLFAIPAFFIVYYFKQYDFKINKIVSYLFYPVHLLIIYIILLFLKQV